MYSSKAEHYFHIVLVCVALFVQGCSKTDAEIVKEGFLASHKTHTVGEALDNYPYFSATKWEKGIKDGVRVVEFTGVIDVKRTVAEYVDYRKDDPKYAPLVQVLGTANDGYVKVIFTLNQDDTFQVADKETFVAITLAVHGGKEKRGPLRPGSWQAIYENKNLFVPQYQL